MTPFELLTGVKMRTCDDVNIKNLIEEEMRQKYLDTRDEARQHAKSRF